MNNNIVLQADSCQFLSRSESTNTDVFFIPSHNYIARAHWRCSAVKIQIWTSARSLPGSQHWALDTTQYVVTCWALWTGHDIIWTQRVRLGTLNLKAIALLKFWSDAWNIRQLTLSTGRAVQSVYGSELWALVTRHAATGSLNVTCMDLGLDRSIVPTGQWARTWALGRMAIRALKSCF